MRDGRRSSASARVDGSRVPGRRMSSRSWRMLAQSCACSGSRDRGSRRTSSWEANALMAAGAHYSPRGSRRFGASFGQRIDGAGVRRSAVGAEEGAAVRPAARSASIAAASRVGAQPDIASRRATRAPAPDGSRDCARRGRTRSAPDRRRRRRGRSDIEPGAGLSAQASAVRFAAEPPPSEDAAGLLRIADPLLEPVQHLELHLARPGRLIHEPAYTLQALATKSPSAAGHVPRTG